jgi:uncharacterized glyoxalase superfamily protein PhnB
MTATMLKVHNLMPGFTVNDLQRSLKFYTEGLGFSAGEEYKDEGVVKGVMLQSGEFMLGISQDDFKKGRDRVKGVGMRVYIETEQNIEEIAKQAKSAGITLDEGPAPLPWGPMGMTVTDPDGFKITIGNPSS